MDFTIIIIAIILVIVLIIFLVRRNATDKKALEDKLKNDYRKPRDDEGDIETEDQPK